MPSTPDLSENRQAGVRALLVAMLVLSLIMLVLRFWSRSLLPGSSMTNPARKRFWWDDWVALMAVIMSITVCSLGLVLVQLGLGLHIGIVSPDNIEPFLQILYAEYFIFDTGTALAKASALLFYARIFSTPNSRFRYYLWAVHAMNVFWWIGLEFAVVFECIPLEKSWNPKIPGSCISTDSLWLGSVTTSLLIDVLILMLPLPMLWRLKMSILRKILIIGVFICAYLVVVVSLGRVISVAQAGASLEEDPTWAISIPILWFGSEIAISVTSVALPCIFSLTKHIWNHGFQPASRCGLAWKTSNDNSQGVSRSYRPPNETEMSDSASWQQRSESFHHVRRDEEVIYREDTTTVSVSQLDPKTGAADTQPHPWSSIPL